MPRNPAAKKGQHNNRHENGLVGPGKRVTKQKSNGQLNGSAKPPLPTEPHPTSSGDSLANNQSLATGATGTASAKTDNTVDLAQLRYRKRDSESSTDGQDPKWEHTNGSISGQGKRADMVSSKSRPSQDLNAMQIASTILRSCPAGDTVALLIVLLALPSMVLTIVQALFASLTLMPPTNVSPASFLSLFDVFQGSAGSPSLPTMAVVDVICFGLWVCLWTWAQNFALDLAQIQIAITLGSGNSSKSGSVNTLCIALVLLLHSVRSKGVRQFLISNLVPGNLWSHPRVAELSQYLPTEADFGSSPGSPTKFRSLFAIHIISQALMAFVRRRVAGTSSHPKTGKRSDTDAFTSSSTHLDSVAQDTVFNAAASTGSDYQPPPTPSFKDGRDKVVSAKKRRRQANQVRSRQPFWAALASTKVHVLREVEHNKGQQGTTPASDSPYRHDTSECVCVTNVEPAAISFEVKNGVSLDYGTSIDAKPCLVRINGADWPSVTMDPAGDDDQGGDSSIRWTGTIYGLAPDCTYTCKFYRSEDNSEVGSIIVRTPALSDGDQPSSSVPTPARQSMRSSSPITTLKQSIQVAESKREEATNRRNRARRNQKSALAKMDREIESWQNKLKSGTDDNKLRQKLLQAERSSRQHEEATNAIAAALDDLETIPEEENDEYRQQKAAFEECKRKLAEANDSLTNARTEANNDLACAKNELNSTLTRKERLNTRNAKLAAEQERLTQANIQNMSEKERKAVESATKEAEQQRQEADWRRRMAEIGNQANHLRMQNETLWQDIANFEISSRDNMIKTGGPLTPEGELPGTNPPPQRAYGFGGIPPTTFIPDPQASPFLSYAKALPPDFRRPRSGTNQSMGAMSGFSADFDDADPIPPMPANPDFEVHSGLNGRKGSGSSRGHNNNSPAGVIGGNLRNSQKGSNSPGHVHGTNTW